MTQPRQHLRHRGCDITRRQGWPVDHDNAQAQGAGGQYLGLGPGTACVFGDDMGDVVRLQKGGIACDIKRAACDDDAGVRQGHTFGRIDQPQQVMVLGFGGKAIKVLLANRQENPRGRIGQAGNRARHVGDMGPKIAGLGLPRGAFKGQKRHAASKACRDRIPAHLGGKGVGGIDNVGNPVAAYIMTQPRHAAKAADPRGQGLRHRMGRATGIGKHRVQPKCGKGRGKVACFGGSPQQEKAHG